MNGGDKLMPKVSVIVPTYNRPQLVLRAVKSVLGQTYRNFEVVIMDDSRNEDTANSIKSIVDPRVRYLHNPVRLDFCENKNYGVKNASSTSEYIAFLDDDDEYLPLFLEKAGAKSPASELWLRPGNHPHPNCHR